jgi:hypothetical protein
MVDVMGVELHGAVVGATAQLALAFGPLTDAGDQCVPLRG